MKIVILTGAGISAESGLKTFRASDGLWENHHVEDVASPEGWERDRELVLRFYNERRRSVLAAKPNAAHLACAKLQEKFETIIITQNIDDLHERAGSNNVIHLHGEIFKAQSCVHPDVVVEIKGDIHIGDKCPRGFQLRPHIVWFGEAVPKMEDAVEITQEADMMLVIGTSLKVYPAASLIHHTRPGVPTYVVDPAPMEFASPNITFIQGKATEMIPPLVEKIIQQNS